MRRTPALVLWFVVLLAFTVLTRFASSQQKNSESISVKGGAGDITGQYEIPDPNWPQWAHPYPKPGYIWGSQGGVFAESPNRIYLANRGELKLPEKVPNNFPGNCRMSRFISRPSSTTETVELDNPLWRITSSIVASSSLKAS